MDGREFMAFIEAERRQKAIGGNKGDAVLFVAIVSFLLTVSGVIYWNF
jgi:hypothetical protein